MTNIHIKPSEIPEFLLDELEYKYNPIQHHEMNPGPFVKGSVHENLESSVVGLEKIKKLRGKSHISML